MESPESNDARRDSPADGTVRATLFVAGKVQGVGFRWWARSRALEIGVVGSARNRSDGRVEIVAHGSREQVADLEKLLREEPSTTDRPGRVEQVSRTQGTVRGDLTGFTSG